MKSAQVEVSKEQILEYFEAFKAIVEKYNIKPENLTPHLRRTQKSYHSRLPRILSRK
jgi:hypothetical protein